MKKSASTALLLTPLGSMHGKSGDPAKAAEDGVESDDTGYRLTLDGKVKNGR